MIQNVQTTNFEQNETNKKIFLAKEAVAFQLAHNVLISWIHHFDQELHLQSDTMVSYNRSLQQLFAAFFKKIVNS